MEHRLIQLPYALDALEPYISEETLNYHYGKHHAGYVKKLNKLIQDTQYADMDLEQIVCKAQDSILNNAAQIWNHDFYWYCLNPKRGGKLDDNTSLAQAIKQEFASLDNFKQQFESAASGLFGSGWTWLVKNNDGKLEIVNTHNADTPIRHGQQPLLCCDVWEHAYYIDYRNSRPDYLTAFWHLTDWSYAEQRFTDNSTDSRRSA